MLRTILNLYKHVTCTHYHYGGEKRLTKTCVSSCNQSPFSLIDHIYCCMVSNSTIVTNPLLNHVISEKLSQNNHLLWRAQVLPVIHGTRLEGFLTSLLRCRKSSSSQKMATKMSKTPIQRMKIGWPWINRSSASCCLR
jgi:hypothetical protein